MTLSYEDIFEQRPDQLCFAPAKNPGVINLWVDVDWRLSSKEKGIYFQVINGAWPGRIDKDNVLTIRIPGHHDEHEVVMLPYEKAE